MADNPDMGGMKGDYLELGQPYYVGAMYWGCEFPETENEKLKVSNPFYPLLLWKIIEIR